MEKVVLEISHESLTPVVDFWRKIHGVNSWFMEDVYKGLCEKFVRYITIESEDVFEKIKETPVLYLANHQTTIESMLFIYLMSGLTNTDIIAIAKEEHKHSWIGKLEAHIPAHPIAIPHHTIYYFDRSNPLSYLELLKDIQRKVTEGNSSILIHTDGTRADCCRVETNKVNRRTIQMAISLNIPIVPVRFIGGLPIQEMGGKFDYPVGYGKQDYFIGSPIYPEDLMNHSFANQKEMILQAINSLGVSGHIEVPNEPDNSFEKDVKKLKEEMEIPLDLAVFLKAIERLPQPSLEYFELMEQLGGKRSLQKESWVSGISECFV